MWREDFHQKGKIRHKQDVLPWCIQRDTEVCPQGFVQVVAPGKNLRKNL